MYDLSVAHVDGYVGCVVAGTIEEQIAWLDTGHIHYNSFFVTVVVDIRGGWPLHLIIRYTQQLDAKVFKYKLYKSRAVRSVC